MVKNEAKIEVRKSGNRFTLLITTLYLVTCHYVNVTNALTEVENRYLAKLESSEGQITVPGDWTSVTSGR